MNNRNEWRGIAIYVKRYTNRPMLHIYSPALQSQYKSISQQSSQHFHIAVFLRSRFQMFNERHEQLALSVGIYLLLVRPPTWAVRSPHIATQIAIMIFMHRYLTPMAVYSIRRPCRFVESVHSQTTWDTHPHRRSRHLLVYCQQSIRRQL